MKDRLPISELQGTYNFFKMRGKPIDLTDGRLNSGNIPGFMRLIAEKAKIFERNLEKELPSYGLLEDIRRCGGPILEIYLCHDLARKVIALAEVVNLKITVPEKVGIPRMDSSDKVIRIDLTAPDICLMLEASEIIATCIQIAAFESRV